MRSLILLLPAFTFAIASCSPETNQKLNSEVHYKELDVQIPQNTTNPKIPFVLSSSTLQRTNDARPILSTIPSQMNFLDGGYNPIESQWYANNIFYERRIYFPDNVAWIQPIMKYFKVEPGADFVEIRHINNDEINNTWKYTGGYKPNKKLRPIPMTSDQRNFLLFTFLSDKNIGNRGWRLSNFEYLTLDLEQDSVHPIKTNYSVDGFLTKTSDVIYFKANYDPDKKHIIHLDHIISSKDSVSSDHYDFDIYVKISDQEERPNKNDFHFLGTSGSVNRQSNSTKKYPLNEVVEIPKDLDGSQIWIAVKSKKNDGQFRLSVNKIAYEVTATVGVGGWNAGWGDETQDEIVPAIANFSDFFAELSRFVYASTDGTILVNKYEIKAGSNCRTCDILGCTYYCELQLLKDKIDTGRRKEAPYHIWLETQRNRSLNAIARTFAHEMGHDYYMQLNHSDPFLPDEYYNDDDHSFNNSRIDSKAGSGHTLMLGSGNSSRLNVTDLNTSKNYNKDPYCYPAYSKNSSGNIVSTGTGHYGCVPTSELEKSNWRMMGTVLNIDYPYYIMKGRQPDPHTYESSYPCGKKPNYTTNWHSTSISFKKLIHVEVFDSKIYVSPGVFRKKSGLYRYNTEKCNHGLIGVPR